VIDEIVTAGASPPTTTEADSRASIGQQDFLRMLIAQLENQDPLEPQDGTEFTAQLAQFSSLEQLVAVRESVDRLSNAGGNNRTLEAASLIDREVLAVSPSVEVQEGELPGIAIDLAGAADSVTVELRTAGGGVVGRTTLGPVGPGLSEVSWPAETAVPPGTYFVEVDARSGEQVVSSTSLVRGRVTAVSSDGDDVTVRLGTVGVSLSEIRSIRSVGSVGESE
jgi:flagellar basal-body rod modification protein FlgD